MIAESGAKKTAGGSAGSAVTPRKMDIPSFLRPFFGATSSSVFYIPCIHTVFLGGWCFMKGSSKIILVPRIDGSM